MDKKKYESKKKNKMIKIINNNLLSVLNHIILQQVIHIPLKTTRKGISSSQKSIYPKYLWITFKKNQIFQILKKKSLTFQINMENS